MNIQLNPTTRRRIGYIPPIISPIIAIIVVISLAYNYDYEYLLVVFSLSLLASVLTNAIALITQIFNPLSKYRSITGSMAMSSSIVFVVTAGFLFLRGY